MGKLFAIIVVIITLLSIGIFASHHWWMPQAASAHAASIDEYFAVTFWKAGIAFGLSQLILAACVWRYGGRTRRGKPFPEGARWAIVIGTVFVALELVGAATVGRRAWGEMYWTPASQNTMKVQVMGEQFAFYFRYPGPDGQFGPMHADKIDDAAGNFFGLDTSRDPASKDDVVSATLRVPVNRPVELLLDAKDVTHGFYVRELRIQQDMVPGMEIPVHFTPTRIGRYEIACNQLCGLGHYRMRAYMQVMSQEDFNTWMQSQIPQH